MSNTRTYAGSGMWFGIYSGRLRRTREHEIAVEGKDLRVYSGEELDLRVC